MIKPTYPTRPLVRAPSQPDVSSHEDIDWRVVSVAEAIDEDNKNYAAMRARLLAIPRRSKWDTFLQVIGVRKSTP
jgi:hypothetical protein